MIKNILMALLLPSLSHCLSLDPGYGDHMVLQQGRMLGIRGSAAPSSQVSLKIGAQAYSAKADAKGRFSVAVPGLRPGGPHELELSAGGETLKLTDVLVGELWLASGQSNMEWPMKLTDDADKQLKQADRPAIRLFSVAHKLAAAQGGKPEGKWALSSPETARDFPAVAWHFAVKLQDALHVPVGIVAAPWSGTPGEAWAPLEAVQAEPGLAEVLKRWQARPEAEQRMYLEGWDFELEAKDIALVKKDGGRVELDAGGAWKLGVAEGSTSECVNGRYTGRLKPGAWSGASLSLAAGNTPIDLRPYVAVEYKAKSNTKFDVALGQPSITDGDNAAFTQNEPSSEWKSYRHLLKDGKQQGWGERRAVTLGSIDSFKLRIQAPNQFPDQPGLLFDAMIRPFSSLTFKGALWYQGESNVGRDAEYRLLLKAMVEGWRKALGDELLGFYVVQLPEFGKKQKEPGESAWAALRAAQASVLSLPRTGLAVSLGLGDPADVHPRRKREVAERLANEALGKLYGMPGLRGYGPLCSSVKREGKELVLNFESGPAPRKGYAIAGADGVWRWAKVKVKGNEVRLTHKDAPEPVKARYAWADVPDFDKAQETPSPTFEVLLAP